MDVLLFYKEHNEKNLDRKYRRMAEINERIDKIQKLTQFLTLDLDKNLTQFSMKPEQNLNGPYNCLKWKVNLT